MASSLWQKNRKAVKANTLPIIYGLVGFPITHSLSPAMHNAAFKKLKIDALYMLFEKTEEGLAPALTQLKLMKAGGFNVTVPYKEAVIPFLDEIDEQARQIGAVNTVVYKKGKFIGYNTDAVGFITSLKNDLECNPKGKNAFIIGAGGAARAIGFTLAKERVKAIRFYDIVPARAKKLAQDVIKALDAIGERNIDISFVQQASNKRGAFAGIEDADILVNASTCGMKKDDPLPIDPTLLPKGIVVYDIIYNPTPTKLIKAVKVRGIKGVNGLGMLLYQGALAFEIWTKQKAPIDTMHSALLKAMK